MNGHELVSRLIDAGLVAKCVGDTDQRIMGGTSCVHTEAGIDVYSHGFSIFPVPDGWMVLVCQVGQSVLETQVAELEQALTILLNEYGLTKNAQIF